MNAKHRAASKVFKQLRDLAQKRLSRKKGRPFAKPVDPTRELLQELESYQAELEIQNEELLMSQEELSCSREEFKDLYDSAPVGFMSLTLEGVVVKANQKAAKMLGIPGRELVGRRLTDFILPDDQDKCLLCKRKLLGGPKPASCELRLLRGKQPVWADIHCSVVPCADRKASQWRLAMADADARKQSEEMSIRAQKLESLGVLAGGIAHDFNNLLTCIIGNIHLARQELKPGSNLDELLNESEEACDTAKGLARQLLTFSHGGAPVLECAELPSLLRKAAALALTGSRQKCVFWIPDKLRFVRLDRNQFCQVITNLVINAQQAMADRGTVSVEAADVELSQGELPPLPPGPYVRIKVKDSGPGIAPEHLTRLFDPYFSTKEAGHGLGLAVSRSIVIRHGGQITARTLAGQGTTFEIHLPAAPKGDIPEETPPPKVLRGTGRILVMDDEPAVARVLSRILIGLGYDPETAPDGESALAAYANARAAKKPFVLSILDLTVAGGMGGQEMMKHLLELDPEAKAVVSSGYSEDPVMADCAAFGFAGALPKPYIHEEVSAVLDRLLNPPKS